MAINKTTEGDLYADHPLGRYLKQIVPAQHKPLFDPSCLSAIISERLGLGWVKETELVTVAGPAERYRWTKANSPGSVRVIRQIDQRTMQLDLFNTIKGRPTKLVAVGGKRLASVDPAAVQPFTSGALYLGKYETGLYPGGKNEMPPAHRQAGERIAASIRPLDSQGQPDDQNGRILALAMGHSNCRMYFGALQKHLAGGALFFAGQPCRRAQEPKLDQAQLVLRPV